MKKLHGTLGLLAAILSLVGLRSPAMADTAIFDVDYTVGVVPPGFYESSSHTFHGEVGDAVMIRAADIFTTAFIPQVQLLDPDDVAVDINTQMNIAWLTTQLPKSGTYTIVVADADPSVLGPGGGTYHLYGTRSPYSNEGGVLTNGGKVAGTIDFGDFDSFTFEATAGDGARIRMVELNDTLDFSPTIRLIAPDGTLEEWATGDRVAEIREEGAGSGNFTTLSQTGTYTVLAFDGNPSSGTDGPIGTGPYEIHLTRMPGARSAGYLIDGVTRSGNIELGEMDSYQLIVTGPASTTVTFTKTSGDFTPRADLYDPTGDWLDWYNPGTDYQTFSAAGTYTIIVSDVHAHDRTGSYEFVITGAGGPPPVPISPWASAALGAVLAGVACVRLGRSRA